MNIFTLKSLVNELELDKRFFITEEIIKIKKSEKIDIDIGNIVLRSINAPLNT